MTYRAPGRVNLIGEHTDYNLGFVLPIALDLACHVTREAADDGCLRAFSEDLGEERCWDIAALADAEPAADWGDYIAGVARELLRAGYTVAPARLRIRSTVPVGAGLSSSAALEVATALALLADRPMEPLDLARLCHRAETGFVGLPCGIMDQFISVFAREHAALRLDCRSLEAIFVGLPENAALVAVNTMVKHALGQSAYRTRVAECGQAVSAIRARRPEVSSLREASPDDFGLLEGLPLKRARHVVTENLRVEQFVDASRRGDLETMGRLFIESHRSLQRDYEVSCEELDFLVDTALTVPGVYGARLTGGGFGGCTVNLLEPEALPRFRSALSEAYSARFGLTPHFYPCHPGAGAGRV